MSALPCNDQAERIDATEKCLGCSIWQQCGSEAIDRGERDGVWGALDLTAKSGKRSIIYPKRCVGCDQWMVRRHGEGVRNFARRLYHDQSCANRANNAKRRAAA